MTEQQARVILQSYRPGSDDPDDPQFAEALRETERNPELAEWLKEEQTFDCAVADKLAEVPEPLGLKTRILALHQQPERKSSSWSLAAILAVVAAVLFLWRAAAKSAPDYDFRRYRVGLELFTGDGQLRAHAAATRYDDRKPRRPARLADQEPDAASQCAGESAYASAGRLPGAFVSWS